MKIRREVFAQAEDTGTAFRFYLKNEKGNYAVVTNYGCTVKRAGLRCGYSPISRESSSTREIIWTGILEKAGYLIGSMPAFVWKHSIVLHRSR